jgi:Pyruvate/2-oxoacid:ferredoxin oxidoreductase delta subunit
MPYNRIILLKHEHPDTPVAAAERGIVEQCQARHLDCLVVPPLYHLAESSKLWKALADCVEQAVWLGRLHPRPIRWLLHRHQITVAESQILDLRPFADADSAISAVMQIAAGADDSAGRHSKTRLERLRAPTRPRWYPVIDATRCINCQHCLQFCLFGVYELDAGGKVEVRQPDQCKPGCPACARICPQSAIMFPLYEKDVAIAGAPGKLVALDAAARRMFYTRTGQPCSACGRKVDKKLPAAAAGEGVCPECGRPLPSGASSPPAPSIHAVPGREPSKESGESAQRSAFSDLDDLVDQLDRAMQRRG